MTPVTAAATPTATTTGLVDLDSRAAIHDLVVDFYREIVFDELLEPVFGEVAEVDWTVHIPHLIDYWCRVLLGQPGYDGAIVRAHAHVHAIEPLRVEHFERWYELWEASIDRRWQGPVADRAKAHAARIAGVLSTRLLGMRWQPTPAGVSEGSAGTVSPA